MPAEKTCISNRTDRDLSEIIGKANPPDVILFEFETAQSDFALTMMRDHPGDRADKGGSGEKQNAGAVECVVPSADH